VKNVAGGDAAGIERGRFALFVTGENSKGLVALHIQAVK
jgi:hypothetical protein